MKVINFRFVKINAEKLSDNFKDVKINMNINLSDIQEVKSNIDKEKLFNIKFKNTISYDPNFAKIELNGILLVLFDQQTAEQITKEWKNNKISDSLKLPLSNLILKKSNLRALQLEEELGIPTHIPMPSLKLPEKAKLSE